MIRDFCRRFKEFDCVNIQLEHGTLGRDKKDIVRRFEWIAKAAPALSVTFHTILPQNALDYNFIWSRLGRLRLISAGRFVAEHRANNFMNHKIYSLLRKLSRSKPVSVIVHTRRDMRTMRFVNRIDRVYHHPLAFLTDADACKMRAESRRDQSPALANLPANATLIGVFGFMSEYKGFDTVVKAMHRLPDNYHLAFFGALHPNEIVKWKKSHPFIDKLLAEAYIDASIADSIGGKSISLNLDSSAIPALIDHPRNIGHRLHFMGEQTDESFARGMALCDVVVLPYLEVGQSSSGPMSLALEMGARIIAARNHAFMQFARYHPNSVEFFEIGNHVELAARIMAPAAFPPETRPQGYGAATNAEIYVTANNGRVTQDEARQVVACSQSGIAS